MGSRRARRLAGVHAELDKEGGNEGRRKKETDRESGREREGRARGMREKEKT